MVEDVLEGLNPAQRAAVEAVRGPVVILAGAGTGKTTTITRRIANQVASGAFEPRDILAVTFTTKAAQEMKGRLAALGVEGVRANTFHAEALAQFRRFSADQPEILGGKGQILHRIARALPMPHKFTALRDLATEIEWAKNRRIGARDYLEELGDHEPPIPPELMHKVYVTYEKRKRQAGMIDFEDLLERTAAILAEDERALGLLRGRYRAFTVDEYQDVNLLQQTLLDQWVGARDDLCVVGDDYQSIFGFTGATPSYLLRFARRYDHAHVVTLEENYRSTEQVLTVANRLVPRLGGSAKRLRAREGATGPNPALRSFETGDGEVMAIVDEARRLNDEGVPFHEMAVLVRINGRSEEFEEAFARAKVPYQVRDGSFLQRPAARAFGAKARRMTGMTAADATAQVVSSLGHDPKGVYEGGDEGTRQADLARLLLLAEGFEGPVEEFLTDLRARFASDQDGRGVQIMTYHRAKGLEFDAVFLPRLEEKELPFAMATADEDVTEERRLFYVGITRARRHLWLSYAEYRPGERRTKPRPSRFLREITPGAAGSKPAKTPAGEANGTKRAVRAADQVDPADKDLFEALRAWRMTVASEKGLPPYVIFHDATLIEIASQRPTTPAGLRSIAGVGALKMQRYGEQVLTLVADASQEGEPVPASG